MSDKAIAIIAYSIEMGLFNYGKIRKIFLE